MKDQDGDDDEEGECVKDEDLSIIVIEALTDLDKARGEMEAVEVVVGVGGGVRVSVTVSVALASCLDDDGETAIEVEMLIAWLGEAVRSDDADMVSRLVAVGDNKKSTEAVVEFDNVVVKDARVRLGAVTVHCAVMVADVEAVASPRVPEAVAEAV